MCSSSATSPEAKAVPNGFTVCELLVVLASVGTLLSLVLPAVFCVREAARHVACCNQLHELGIAIHAYHDVHQRFPAAWQSQEREPSFLVGWATAILPELGEQSVALILRNAPNPEDALSSTSLGRLLCPADITESTFELRVSEELPFGTPREWSTANARRIGRILRTLPTASYVGVFGTTEADDQNPTADEPASEPSDGTIVHDRLVRMADLRRGTSQTLLVGERTMAMVPSTWLGVDVSGDDAQCRLVGSAMTSPNCRQCDECEFSSRHAGGANFLWADGHVELMEDSVDTAAYRRYAQRSVE